MALQSSGAISLNDVNVELGNLGTITITMNDTAVRALAGITSGPISMYDFYGKSLAIDYFFEAVASQSRCESTNLATNLTIVDSSSNNFTVSTASSTPAIAQSSFSPFLPSDHWGLQITSSLVAPSDSNEFVSMKIPTIALSSGPWCVEFWYRGDAVDEFTDAVTISNTYRIHPNFGHMLFYYSNGAYDNFDSSGTSCYLHRDGNVAVYHNGIKILDSADQKVYITPGEKWYHIAMFGSLSQGYAKLYIDGYQTSSISGVNAPSNIKIDRFGPGRHTLAPNNGSSGLITYQGWPGTISNFRVSYDAENYSNMSSFNVPTTAFNPADNQTYFLTFCGPTLKNYATGSYSLGAWSGEVLGNPGWPSTARATHVRFMRHCKIVAESPFRTKTAYSPSTHGGSIFMQYNSGGLTTNSSSLFSYMGADSSNSGVDWTIEAWVYLTHAAVSYPSNYFSFSKIIGFTGTGIPGQVVGTDYAGPLGLFFNSFNAKFGPDSCWALATTYGPTAEVGLSLYGDTTPGVKIPYNSWVHVGLCYEASTRKFSFMANGYGRSYEINNANVPNSGNSGSRYVTIGKNLELYISNLRISKGVLRYPILAPYPSIYAVSTYTVPTAPFTNDANTALLLSFNNAKVFCDSGTGTYKLPNPTAGNVVNVTTSQYKFGSSALNHQRDHANGGSSSVEVITPRAVHYPTQTSGDGFMYKGYPQDGAVGAYTIEFWWKSGSGTLVDEVLFEAPNGKDEPKENTGAYGDSKTFSPIYINNTNISGTFYAIVDQSGVQINAGDTNYDRLRIRPWTFSVPHNITVTNWNHFALVRDPLYNRISIYINGTRVIIGPTGVPRPGVTTFYPELRNPAYITDHIYDLALSHATTRPLGQRPISLQYGAKSSTRSVGSTVSNIYTDNFRYSKYPRYLGNSASTGQSLKEFGSTNVATTRNGILGGKIIDYNGYRYHYFYKTAYLVNKMTIGCSWEAWLIGGGGGGGYSGAGGGGAGGMAYVSGNTLQPGDYINCVIGAGGGGATAANVKGSSGGTTYISTSGSVYLSRAGGGGGAGSYTSDNGLNAPLYGTLTGAAQGCGGGAAGNGTAGAGYTNGGTASFSWGGGGGGGIAANGTAPTASVRAGDGGNGSSFSSLSISDPLGYKFCAGGGGGAIYYNGNIDSGNGGLTDGNRYTNATAPDGIENDTNLTFLGGGNGGIGRYGDPYETYVKYRGWNATDFGCGGGGGGWHGESGQGYIGGNGHPGLIIIRYAW